MPSDAERLDALENSVLSLAANKLDITDYNTSIGNVNTDIADLRSTIASFLSRIEALQQYLVNQV